jgi:hypothetical protein
VQIDTGTVVAHHATRHFSTIACCSSAQEVYEFDANYETTAGTPAMQPAKL